MRSPKKHLSFDSLREGLSKSFNQISDYRTRQSTYSIHDTLMSGFAMMYFQEPSLLQFQKSLEESHGNNNLHSIFKVHKTPQESQMREITDQVGRENFRPIFKDFLLRLQRGKHLREYQLFPNLHLISLDGSQYFHSKNLHCSGCLEKNHRSGDVSYSHQIIQAAIMHPDQKQVLPLMPEEIRNEDGHKKQDCEFNGTKRLIERIYADHPRLGIILCGDGLFSKQPLIELTLEKKMHYIFVAKPDDHNKLMEWVDVRRATGGLENKVIVDDAGKKHIYEWVNDVDLNGSKNSIRVNYFCYQQVVTNKQGAEKVTYKNSWVTDFRITSKNIVTLVRGGRCRWKIENECFNTLKNQGYHLEHNYGHGEKNLSFNFLLLTLLAFYFHQIFELTDHLYQDCRKKYGSKKNLWNKLKTLIVFFVFESWYKLLNYIFTPPPPIVLPQSP